MIINKKTHTHTHTYAVLTQFSRKLVTIFTEIMNVRNYVKKNNFE